MIVAIITSQDNSMTLSMPIYIMFLYPYLLHETVLPHANFASLSFVCCFFFLLSDWTSSSVMVLSSERYLDFCTVTWTSSPEEKKKKKKVTLPTLFLLCLCNISHKSFGQAILPSPYSTLNHPEIILKPGERNRARN